MSIWQKLFGKREKITRLYDEYANAKLSVSTDTSDKNTCIAPSEFLPDFPLNPLRTRMFKEPIKNELLANVAAVGSCICYEMAAWKRNVVKRDWPSYADDELRALLDCYQRMKADVPPSIVENIDKSQVRRLVRDYLRQIAEHDEAYSLFLRANLTLLGMTIDFSNTIGYGGIIQDTLNWYE